MKILIPFALMLIFCSLSLSAKDQEQPKRAVVYKYKQFERFDFEDMMIEGESGIPGDLTITPTFKRFYKNTLPNRENFNGEIENAIDSIN